MRNKTSKPKYQVPISQLPPASRFKPLANTMTKNDNKKPDHDHCACCGPTEYEFPEELLTPELKALKDSMSKEEFEELMKSLM